MNNLKVGTKVKCHAQLTRYNDGAHIEQKSTNPNFGPAWILFPSYDDPRRQELDHIIDESMVTPIGLVDELGRWNIGKVPEWAVSDCSGGGILKTYYKVIDREFTGFVSNIIDVPVVCLLYVDTNSDPYTGDEVFVGKETKETIKCAKVFYALGKSRLVPLDKLEVVQ